VCMCVCVYEFVRVSALVCKEGSKGASEGFAGSLRVYSVCLKVWLRRCQYGVQVLSRYTASVFVNLCGWLLG
jgi:hypothetical protein